MVNRINTPVAINASALRRQAGLTMVELLVAIALGLFLSWGAIQAFLTGKQTYIMQQALSRIQENARTAQELIGYDIRSAGSYGCATGRSMGDADDVNFLTGSSHATYAGSTNPTAERNFAYAAFAVNNVSGAANADTTLLAPLNPAPLAGTDVLVVHNATDLGAQILAAPAPAATQFSVPNRGFAQTDILSVSDCTSNFIFQPTAVATAGTTQRITHPLRGALSPAGLPVGANVMRLNSTIYYIANNPAGTPSLYRRVSTSTAGTSEELLSGVQNLQVEVGIDTNNDAVVDEFRTPDAVTAAQWNAWDDSDHINGIQEILDATTGNFILPANRHEQNVVAIRYSLLLRSAENFLLEAPQPYTYNGVLTTPPITDRSLYQVVTSTVGIRGRSN